MTTVISQCALCVHFHHDQLEDDTCNAFPLGIPESILLNEHDHRLPFEGDNGIRFVLKEDRDES
jgi:hypothetical protein